MLNRVGHTIFFENPPTIKGYASVVGKKEANGPLKDDFDVICLDALMGEKSFEKAEAKLQKTAVTRALSKSGLEKSDINFIMGGDLLNQCVSSSYGLRDFGIAFLGLYGACSTMCESLGLASLLCASGAAEYAAAVSSSHFCSAERQFRYPIRYGGQRPPTAQWTVTGAGSVIVSKESDKTHPTIDAITFGTIEDLGITDINNMGAAMAPAAASTIYNFLKDSQTSPEDYDLILTGDLGLLGSDLLIRLLKDNGVDIKSRHNDCGLIIYEREKQDVHAGGSGCGCSASVLCSKILKEIESGKLNRVLLIATGALMSPITVQQGESIPSVAHLVSIKGGRK